MAGVLDLLQQFLCYGNSPAATSCMQEFQQYAYQPMEGIFYAVFFPIVFIVIFIYIISGTVGAFTRGIRILVAMAVLAFIIIQGYYYYFILMSKMWLFVIIFLGVLWMIMHTFVGRGGGGGKARALGGEGGGGPLGRAFSLARRKALGKERDEIRSIKDDLALLGNLPKGSHGVDEVSGRILANLNTLRADSAFFGVSTAKDYAKLRNEYNRVANKKNVKVFDGK